MTTHTRYQSLVAAVGILISGFAVAGCAGIQGAETQGTTDVLNVADAQQQIARLQRRYALATDRVASGGDADIAAARAVYQQIFTPDASIGVAGQPPVTGPDAWLALVQASLGTLRGSQHLIGSQVVDVTGLPGAGRESPGEASMTSVLQATQVAADGSLTRIYGNYVVQARYTQAAGWQMANMKLHLLAVDAPQPPPAQPAE